MIHSVIGHLKFKLLKCRLKLSQYATVGVLESIWIIGKTTCHDGAIGKYTDEEIATEIEWEGDPAVLIGALVECRWLDRCENNRLVIHDWADHCPRWVKGILARQKKGPAELSSQLSSQLSSELSSELSSQLEDQQRITQHNITKQNKETPPTLPSVEPPQRGGVVAQKIPYDPKNAEMPTELDCPEFRQAWADWFAYRREKKLSIWKQSTIDRKFIELAEMGQAGAIAAINQSISNGWHGIFPPKPTATTHTNGKTLSPEAQKTRDLYEATKKMILAKPSNSIPIAGPNLGLGFFKTAKTPNPTTEPPKLITDENKAHSDDEPENELNW